MNRQAFESIAEEWFGPLDRAAARIGAPVAKRLGPEPARVYLVQLNYRAPGLASDSQPPQQVWCSYPHHDGSAFVITSPKTLGLWSIPDNVYLMLGTYTQMLLHDESGFEAREFDTPDAFAYIVGPFEFVRTAVLEWMIR